MTDHFLERLGRWSLFANRDLRRPIRRIDELIGVERSGRTNLHPRFRCGPIFLERGEFEERLFDQLVDDRALRGPDPLLLAHRALDENGDVERADRLSIGIEKPNEVLRELAGSAVTLQKILRERLVDDAFELGGDL